MKKWILFITLAAAILAAGCTKDYKDDDIKKYISEEMKLSSFSVIEGPVDFKGEDGYTDRIWTVSTDDFQLGEELVFHVCDDHYWSLEWVANLLTNDLTFQKERVLLDKFVLPDGFRVEEVTDSGGQPYMHYIVCGFDGRADFEKGIDLIRAFREHAKDYPTISDTGLLLSFRTGDKGLAHERQISGYQYTLSSDAALTDAEAYEKLQKASDEYLMDCIECGLLDRMSEYSDEERSRVIREDDYSTEIRRIGEETAAYPGYAYARYYSVPCGTLYHILEEEGYGLTGDWTSFSFAGSDGEVHICSYEDNNRGEIDVDDINAWTDLHLDDGAEMKTIVIDEKLLQMLGKDAETFAGELLALDGNYYRKVEVQGSAVRIEGKSRELGRLVRIYEKKIEELRDTLRTYNGWYGFTFNNMHRVYQGISIRIGSDVPREVTERAAGEACALAALCQVINAGEVYDWSLEVTFEKMKDGQTEKLLTYNLPGDTIDYGAVYRKMK